MGTKGLKLPHDDEWKRKISEGVKRQHAEGRGSRIGFTKYAIKKAVEKTWKGEDVSYVGLHRWVAYWKGRPKKCEKCGSTSARKYEWANIDHTYKRVLEDYIRMCTSCHRKYDYNKNLGGYHGDN